MNKNYFFFTFSLKLYFEHFIVRIFFFGWIFHVKVISCDPVPGNAPEVFANL